jgi:transcriptional regulator with XRE-family HTH domain
MKSEGIFMITMGDKLKAARKNKGLRQDDVAEALGIQRQAISQYERSANFPSRKNLEKLAELYNVSVDYLRYDNQNLGAYLEFRLNEEYGVGNLTEWEIKVLTEKILKIYDLVKESI